MGSVRPHVSIILAPMKPRSCLRFLGGSIARTASIFVFQGFKPVGVDRFLSYVTQEWEGLDHGFFIDYFTM